MNIPNSVIGVISDAFAAHHTHAQLDTLFREHGAPGDPEPGNKVVKCSSWLRAVNAGGGAEPITFLGALLENYMDYEIPDWEPARDRGIANRARIGQSLAKHGLSYVHGGHITVAGSSAPARTLEAILRERDFTAIQEEFERGPVDQ